MAQLFYKYNHILSLCLICYLASPLLAQSGITVLTDEELSTISKARDPWSVNVPTYLIFGPITEIPHEDLGPVVDPNYHHDVFLPARERAIEAVPWSEIAEATSSHKALMAFIMNSETPYFHRLAAIDAGYREFDLIQIPHILSVQHQASKFDNLVKRSPSQIRYQRSVIGFQNLPKKLFGQTWEHPEKQSPYPNTVDALAKTPYPWQIKDALDYLFWTLRDRLSSPEDRQIWLEMALAMPSSTMQEEIFFEQAIQWIYEFPPLKSHWHLVQAVIHRHFKRDAPRDSPSLRRVSTFPMHRAMKFWQTPEAYWLTYALELESLQIKLQPHYEIKPFVSGLSGGTFPATLIASLAEIEIPQKHTAQEIFYDAITAYQWYSCNCEVMAPEDKPALKKSFHDLAQFVQTHLPDFEKRMAEEKPYLDWALDFLNAKGFSAPFPGK